MHTYTEWLDARSNKPPRVGSYQYRYADTKHAVFAVQWDGRQFIIDDGSDFTGEPVIYQRGDQWRALDEQVAA